MRRAKDAAFSSPAALPWLLAACLAPALLLLAQCAPKSAPRPPGSTEDYAQARAYCQQQPSQGKDAAEMEKVCEDAFVKALHE